MGLSPLSSCAGATPQCPALLLLLSGSTWLRVSLGPAWCTAAVSWAGVGGCCLTWPWVAGSSGLTRVSDGKACGRSQGVERESMFPGTRLSLVSPHIAPLVPLDSRLEINITVPSLKGTRICFEMADQPKNTIIRIIHSLFS